MICVGRRKVKEEKEKDGAVWRLDTCWKEKSERGKEKEKNSNREVKEKKKGERV